MNTSQVLTGSQLKSLGSGVGDPDSIAALRLGQHNKWLMTLNSLISTVGEERIEECLSVLFALRDESPETFFDVTTYPLVQMWSSIALECAMGIRTDDPLDDHLTHLRCLVAVLAWRSGRDFEIKVPLRGGSVDLPSVGRASFSDAGELYAIVRTAEGNLWVCCGEQLIDATSLDDQTEPEMTWEPLRSVRLDAGGLRVDLVIDDLDPYRGYITPSACEAQRLSNEQLESWSAQLHSAWQILVERHREYAEAMAAGLRVLVPLHDDTYVTTDTSRDAFGAVASSVPPDAETLAFLLLSSFQQAKLSGLHDLIPLHREVSDAPSRFAPWSRLPRSPRQILEGIFSHSAILDFWTKRSWGTSDDVEQIDAEVSIWRWQARADHVTDMVVATVDLTDIGAMIIRSLAARFRAREWVVPSDEVRVLARKTEEDVRISWRLRNLVVSDVDVALLANAWLAADICPDHSGAPLAISDVDHGVARHVLRRKATCAAIAARRAGGSPSELRALISTQWPAVSKADLEYVTGELSSAHRSYRAEIIQNVADRDSWAGYCLTAPSSSLGGVILKRSPEIVYSVSNRIRATGHTDPDPTELAAWLMPFVMHQCLNQYVVPDKATTRP